MTQKNVTNLAASVQRRLLNHAQEHHDEPQLVLMRYGLERLLYRLSKSGYGDEFVVKGAMLFWVWTGDQYRPTKDLDLMTARVRSAEQLETLFMSVCTVPVEADGLAFLALSVKAEKIREEDTYGGMRVTLEARLGRAKIPLQVDIGFGDAITPKAVVAEFPALLAMSAPRLAMYPRETVVAEKFETMVKLGLLNSRMKDFYDIWILARDFTFDGETLTAAIRATFKRRRTALPTEIPLGLSDAFADDTGKQAQWRGFVKRSRLKETDLAPVLSALRDFLMPPTMAARAGTPAPRQWPKDGPWTAGR